MTAPHISRTVVDGKGSVRITLGQRTLGTLMEHRRGGWSTEGACIGPLAERHADLEDAIAVLVDFQLGRKRAVA